MATDRLEVTIFEKTVTLPALKLDSKVYWNSTDRSSDMEQQAIAWINEKAFQWIEEGRKHSKFELDVYQTHFEDQEFWFSKLTDDLFISVNNYENMWFAAINKEYFGE